MRALKITAIGLAVLLGLSLTTLIAAALYLDSESGSRLLLTRGAKALEPHGIEFSAAQGRLRILSGLSFENLVLKIRRPDLDLDLKVARLDLSYDFSVFRRSLSVSQLLIDNPNLRIRQKSSSEKMPDESTKEEDTSLAELIRKPPLQFELKAFVLRNLNLDFESLSPGNQSSVKVAGLGAEMKMSLKPKSFESSGQIESKDDLQLASQSAESEIRTQASLRAQWKVSVRSEGDGWAYNVEPLNVTVRSPQTLIISKKQGQSSRITISQATLTSQNQILAEGAKLFQLSQDQIKTFESDLALNLKSVEIGKDRLGPQNLKLTAGLGSGSGMAVVLNLESRDISSRENLLKPLDLKSETKINISRDLRHLVMESQFFAQKLKLVQLKAEARRENEDLWPLTVTGEAKVSALLEHFQTLKALSPQKATAPLQLDLGFDSKLNSSDSGQMTLKVLIPELKNPALPRVSKAELSGLALWDLKNSAFEYNGALGFENPELGSWSLSTKSKLQASNNSDLTTEGQTTLTQSKPAKSEKIPAEIPKPLEIEHRISIGKNELVADIKGKLPQIVLKKMATVHDSAFSLKTKSPKGRSTDQLNLDAELHIQQGRTELDPVFAKSPLPIKGLELRALAQVRDGTSFILESLSAKLNGSTLSLSAEGRGNLKTQTAQGQAEVRAVLPSDFPSLAGHSISGEAQIPMTFSIKNGRDVSIDGGVALKKVSWAKGAASLSGIEGRLPFSERLIWDEESIRFRDLITQNPFERVNFERVRPLLQSAEQMRIARLSWEGRSFGPLIGFFSIKQNMFSIHQFDLDMGRGRLAGEFFLNAHPANLQLGVLTRMTNLDLNEILPPRYLVRAPTGDKKVSGRSGFVVSLNRSTMDGRIDITEIGGSQLISVINVLDPSYEDEKMNKVRSLLQVGYPTAVGLAFSQGYLDMDIQLSLLGLGQSQRLRAIPVSSLISQATNDVVEKTKKGPLK